MPALPQSVLHAKLLAALPAGTVSARPDETHSAEFGIPGIGDIRVYLWTVTHVESEDRPLDEYKIQLILPGQTREQRGRLIVGDKPTLLLGYSPDFGVFVGWEATLHRDFSFSAAKQIKEVSLEEGRRSGWAVATPRTLRVGGLEVRVAFSPANLALYVRLSIAADAQGLSGVAREAFFLAATPNAPPLAAGDAGAGAEVTVKRMRRKLLVARAQRDARFGPLVKKEYDFSCAVCGMQLGIVEGAHIIPASAADGEDEIWNGIALCPNHHKLFDASTFVVTQTLRVKIDDTALAFFEESGIYRGVEAELRDFDDAVITAPHFFAGNTALRERMIAALGWRERLAALVD